MEVGEIAKERHTIVDVDSRLNLKRVITFADQFSIVNTILIVPPTNRPLAVIRFVDVVFEEAIGDIGVARNRCRAVRIENAKIFRRRIAVVLKFAIAVPNLRNREVAEIVGVAAADVEED